MNAWAESQVGRPDRARAALLRIAPEDAQTAGVRAARAHVLIALGDTDRARQDLEAAFRLEPENVLARITMGRLALAENRPDAAADDLMRALARWPDSRDELGLRYVIDRLIVTSDAAFARAVALRPGDPQVWVARGRHLAWLGRWKDASDAFAKGITSRPPADDWIEYAAVLVLAGDDAGYRLLCDRIVEHTKKVGSDRHWFAHYAAWRISGFSSASGVAPELMVHWIDAARALDPNQTWLENYPGAARLRARNQDASTLRLLNVASEQTHGWHGAGITWYALAIVHRRLGHDVDSWMADRNRDATTASTVLPKLPLRDYLEAKILEREAKSQ
jgi:tetratricopeptide (TPR) repeat protein